MMLAFKDPSKLPDKLPLREGASYVLPPEARQALHFAWAANRPLLVLGEAGVGKTELARAFAAASGADLLQHTMKSSSTAEDLLWTVDHVARLATAQILGQGISSKERDEKLALSHFVRPGILWRALDAQPTSAEPKNANAKLVLIDEIDKAPHDVPNNLLDVLDVETFQLPDGKAFQRSLNAPPYMVMITSNRDKALPPAFLRRCAVLRLTVDETALEQWLIERAQAQFGGSRTLPVDEVLVRAAAIIKSHRVKAKYKPATSEYLDLIRAVVEASPRASDQLRLLDEFAPYIRKDAAA